MRAKILFALVATFGAWSHLALAIVPGDYQQNASFMSYNYLHAPSYSANCDLADLTSCPTLEFAHKSDAYYAVTHWFPNAGNLDDSGRISATSVPRAAVSFLNALAAYENQYGVSFTVLAMLNRDNSGTTPLDLADATVRASIVDECINLVSTTTAGSYIRGATRAFDGVVLDIEPTGPVLGDDSYFNLVKQLMIEIQSAFRADPALAGKQTAFTAPKFGTGDRWFWNASYYHYMARHVDYLIAMTYDSRETTGGGYSNWLAQQTQNILDSVSGRWWNFDADHPAPTNGVKVFIGFPAFPHRPPIHYRNAENAVYAARGTLQGLQWNDQPPGDISNSYFQGAAMYTHVNGRPTLGPDGQPDLMRSYATYSWDWWWWGRYWLGAW